MQEETDRGHETLKSEPPASIPDVSDGVKVSCPEESTGTGNVDSTVTMCGKL